MHSRVVVLVAWFVVGCGGPGSSTEAPGTEAPGTEAPGTPEPDAGAPDAGPLPDGPPYVPAPPTLPVAFPPPRTATDASAIRFRGTTSDPVGVTAVRVAGVLATTGDGFATWTA